MGTIWYQNIFVSLPKDVVKHIIGKNGSHTTKLANELGLKYIWYNCDTNAFTMYGHRDILNSAKDKFCEAIETTVKKFAPTLTNTVYNSNPVEDEITHIPLTNVCDTDICKHIIGKNGKKFIRITRESGIYFMWYDEPIHSIIIHGSNYHTSKAVEMVYKMIEEEKATQEVFNDCQPKLKKQKTI